MGTYSTGYDPLRLYLFFHVQIYGLQPEKRRLPDAPERFFSILYRRSDCGDHKIQFTGDAPDAHGQGDRGACDHFL